jgi:signal transduction histidine kinase
MEKIRYDKAMKPTSHFRGAYLLSAAGYIIVAAVGLPILWLAFSQGMANRWVILGLIVTVAALFMLYDRSVIPATSRITHLYLALQMLLIAVLELSEPSYFGAVVLFFMLSAQAAASFSWRATLSWVGIFTLVTGGLMFVRGGLEAMPILPIYAGGYFFFAAFAQQTRQAEEARRESQHLLEELREAHRQLRLYADQVEELAVAKERNRLAREMHDTLGHRLTVAAVQLEGAERLISAEPDRAAQMVGTVRDQVRAALGDLRHIVAALRTPLEAELPLPRALTRLADDFEKATGIAVHLESPEELPPLPTTHRLALHRAAQEGLTNVQRHAQAHRVWVTLRAFEDAVVLEVQDDGRGPPPDAEALGFGLRGLRERASQPGGEMQFGPRPGGGTQLALRMPLPEKLRTTSE